MSSHVHSVTVNFQPDTKISQEDAKKLSDQGGKVNATQDGTNLKITYVTFDKVDFGEDDDDNANNVSKDEFRVVAGKLDNDVLLKKAYALNDVSYNSGTGKPEGSSPVEGSDFKKLLDDYLKFQGTATTNQAKAYGSLKLRQAKTLAESFRALSASVPNLSKFAELIQGFGKAYSKKCPNCDQEATAKALKGGKKDVSFKLPPEIAKDPKKFEAFLQRVAAALSHKPEVQKAFISRTQDMVRANDPGTFPPDGTNGADSDPTTMGLSEAKNLVTMWVEQATAEAQAKSQKTGKYVKPKLPPPAMQIKLAIDAVKIFAQICNFYAATESELRPNYLGKDLVFTGVPADKLKDLQTGDHKLRINFGRIDFTGPLTAQWTENLSAGRNESVWKTVRKSDLKVLLELVENDQIQYPSDKNKEDLVRILRMTIDELGTD